MSISGQRAPWRRWRRGITVIILSQFAAVACTSSVPPPAVRPTANPSRPEDVAPYLRQYAVQLENEGISVGEASAYLAGGDLPAALRDGHGNDPAALMTPERVASLPSDLLTTQELRSWRVVDGVAEYRIGPQDVIQITPHLGPEVPQTRTFRVQADGTIFVPRFDLGYVAAAGRTATELSRDLSEAYRRYVPSAYVDVRIEEYNAWSATLVGEIRVGQGIGPGTYPLRGRISAGEFIFLHGGPTANADLSDVRLVHNGVEQRFDLGAALSGQGGTNPALDAGDILRVPSSATGSSRFMVWGEVRSPGVFTVTEGLTALDAIAQAGSLTQNADPEKATVARPSTGEVIPLNLDAILSDADFASDLPVQAGDLIVVPPRDRSFWEKTRDWIGLTTLVISVATVIEILRRNN